MGIVNRSMDVSEQQQVVELNRKLAAASEDHFIMHVPHPMQIQSVKAIASGISGSPEAQLELKRFVVGAGLTTISIGASLAVEAIGTSGPQSFSLPASGSSLLELQEGDVLNVATAGANSAADNLVVSVVVKSLQDIKSWY